MDPATEPATFPRGSSRLSHPSGLSLSNSLPQLSLQPFHSTYHSQLWVTSPRSSVTVYLMVIPTNCGSNQASFLSSDMFRSAYWSSPTAPSLTFLVPRSVSPLVLPVSMEDFTIHSQVAPGIPPILAANICWEFPLF